MKIVYAVLAGLLLIAVGFEVGGYELLLNTKNTALALAMLATGILVVKPLGFLLVAVVLLHILTKLNIGVFNDRRTDTTDSNPGASRDV